MANFAVNCSVFGENIMKKSLIIILSLVFCTTSIAAEISYQTAPKSPNLFDGMYARIGLGGSYLNGTVDSSFSNTEASKTRIYILDKKFSGFGAASNIFFGSSTAIKNNLYAKHSSLDQNLVPAHQ